MKIRISKKGDTGNVGGAMTDISFLLIIFFLVTAVFIADRGLFLTLPQEDSEPMELKPDQVVKIELTEKNEILVDGKTVKSGQLESALKQIISQKGYPVILIETAPEISYQRVLDTLETAKRAGGNTFSILSKEKPIPIELDDEKD